MALITDPDLLAQGVEVTITTGTRQITLNLAGDLSADGVTLQCLYSFLKEEWKNDSALIPYPFPMVAITPEQFEFVNDWEPTNNSTRNLLRTGGWREVDSNGVLKKEYVGIITLGSFEDSVNDLAYYQVGDDPTDTGAAINFVYNGPVNEGIRVYEEIVPSSSSLAISGALDNNTITRSTGSWITDGFKVGAKATLLGAEDSGNNVTREITAVTTTVLTLAGAALTTNADDDTMRVAYNYRSKLKLFLRVRDGDTNGKTYAQSSLTDIGVTELRYQAYRFPLSNGTDLKISETDANIAANAPYTGIRIRYLPSTYNRPVDTTTPRDFGIVVDVGTYSQSNGASNSSTLFTSANIGDITLADYTGGTLIIHEGADAGEYTISGTPVNNSGTLEVTLTGALSATASNLSFTLQRATPLDASAEEIYEKVQYLLRQGSDVDGTTGTVTGRTADEILSFVGDTLIAGSTSPTNPRGGGSGVIIEGFSSNDTNRLTFYDNGGTARNYPFVAAGSITFNSNLVTDGDAAYWMFFQYTERFTNTGFAISGVSGQDATLTSSTTNLTTELANGDYIALDGFANASNNGVWVLTGAPSGAGPWTAAIQRVDDKVPINETAGASVSLDKNPINSPDAIIVKNASGVDISGAIGGSSVSFDFDYDGNVQGGRTAGTDAVIIIRAIGLDTAQFVETTGTIARSVGQSFSLVSALERNYENL